MAASPYAPRHSGYGSGYRMKKFWGVRGGKGSWVWAEAQSFRLGIYGAGSGDSDERNARHSHINASHLRTL